MRVRDEIAAINQRYWGEAAAEEYRPTLDLDPAPLRDYGAGRTQEAPARLVKGMYPADLLAGVEGKDVLCLANGGGQQSVAFAMLGCRVSVLDISELQLERDRRAAEHYGYEVTTVHGDMRDLSAFADGSFDLVYQNISIVFVPDVRPVYREVARVLRPGGYCEVWHCNPATFAVELISPTAGWDGVGYRISESSRPKVVRRNRAGHETFGEGELTGEYAHPLADIFNGLIDCGLTVQGVSKESDETPYLDDPHEPGSELHKRSIVPLYFGVLPRKATQV